MPDEKKVQDLMIPLEDYPHVPYWFTLRQAMAIVREVALKFEYPFEPRGVLVFDEQYRLMGMLTLQYIIRGLEPEFLQEAASVEAEPNLAQGLADLMGPVLKETSQKPVSEIMQPIKVTVQGNDSLGKALFLMTKENVIRLPVIQDNRVAGIIRLIEIFNEISDIVIRDNRL
jgi:CBS domain-containing protein